MRGVTVQPEAKLAHVGTGCLLRDVDRATQQHGLATVLGLVSDTGVAGLTLGGGFGYLTRRFGWTVDNLEKIEIVTAGGTVRTANREQNAELFWALGVAAAPFLPQECHGKPSTLPSAAMKAMRTTSLR